VRIDLWVLEEDKSFIESLNLRMEGPWNSINYSGYLFFRVFADEETYLYLKLRYPKTEKGKDDGNI